MAASDPASATAPAASQGERFGGRRKIAVVALVGVGLAVLLGTLLLLKSNDTRTVTAPPTVTAETAPPAATPLPRDTRPIVASRWERYANTRYGVMIDYPADLFAVQPPPPDNAGREFAADKAGARFRIHSHANAFNLSVEELQAQDVLDIGDDAAAKQSGPDWYQVVATKGAQSILRRVLLSEGNTMVHRLEIAFPAAAATAFEPIVARMLKSYRVAPAIPAKAARDAEQRARPPVLPPTVTPAPPAPVTAVPQRPIAPPASPQVPSSAEKATPPAQTGGFAYRRIESIGLGLHLAGAKSKVGFSVDVPADWAAAQGADRDSLFFAGLDPGYGGEIMLSFVAELRGAGETLESKVEELKSQEDARTRRNIHQGAARIGLHPAIVVAIPMGEFRKTVAYVEKDDHFYYVQLHAPTRLYAKYAPVLERAISSIAFAQ